MKVNFFKEIRKKNEYGLLKLSLCLLVKFLYLKV